MALTRKQAVVHFQEPVDQHDYLDSKSESGPKDTDPSNAIISEDPKALADRLLLELIENRLPESYPGRDLRKLSKEELTFTERYGISERTIRTCKAFFLSTERTKYIGIVLYKLLFHQRPLVNCVNQELKGVKLPVNTKRKLDQALSSVNMGFFLGAYMFQLGLTCSVALPLLNKGPVSMESAKKAQKKFNLLMEQIEEPWLQDLREDLTELLEKEYLLQTRRGFFGSLMRFVHGSFFAGVVADALILVLFMGPAMMGANISGELSTQFASGYLRRRLDDDKQIPWMKVEDGLREHFKRAGHTEIAFSTYTSGLRSTMHESYAETELYKLHRALRRRAELNKVNLGLFKRKKKNSSE